jgi:toxin ParE1/3/4
MAKIVWTEPALDQLDEVAEYIALDNLVAASSLVAKVFKVVDRLERFPNSGREPPELPDSIYREVLCPPCRIFYRRDGKDVLILHVMRDEMQLRKFLLNDAHGGQ